MGVLESITEDCTSFQVDLNNEPELCGLSRDCHEILKDLQNLKHHFDSFPTQTQLTWDRLELGQEELARIRMRLITTISLLNTVYSRLAHSSTKIIIQKLETFIDEIRTGKREGSVVTSHSTGSLSADEKEAWRQLRKELESVGITPALFNQHRDRIIDGLLKAIDDGDLVEDIGDDLSDTTPEPPEERLAVPDPTHRYGDLGADTGEDLSDHAQESSKGRLVIADPASKATPKADLPRTKTSPANPSATLPVKGPSRISKSLFGITRKKSILIVAGEGDEHLVRELLQRGANVELKGLYDGRTPLSWAAGNGHDAVVKLLLATGKAKVETKDNDDRTPLWWAAHNGHEAVVKLLLATGKAEVESKDKYDQTPLWWAARNGHDAVVKLLLATGKAEVESKDNDDRTPLWWAARNGHETVVKLLTQPPPHPPP